MSSRQVVLRRSAKADMVRQVRWLEHQVDTETAERFLTAANESFADLLANPHIGPKVRSHDVELARLRKWRVGGFPNILIFYLIRHDGIQIVRVLPAVADWQSLFDAD